MKNVNAIIIRVFAGTFYRKNATLFLLVLAMAFGFLKGAEHVALASYFTSSILLMMIPLLIWTGYVILVIDFNQKLARKSETRFLSELFLYSTPVQWRAIGQASFIQLLPVLGYATFLATIAFRNHFFLSGIISVLSSAAMLWLVTYRSRYTTMPVTRQKHSFHLPGWRIRRPFVLFPIEHVFRKQLLATVGYKLSSALILFGILQVYRYDTYDLRLLGLSVLIAFSMSVQFILEWHHFENTSLPFVRQMPFTPIQRLLKTMLTILLFSFPEIFVLQAWFPETLELPARVSVVLYGISIPFLFYTFLFGWMKPLEKVMAPIYFFVIISFVLILFQAPLILLSVVHAGLAYWFYARYYYRFERTI